MYNIFDYIDQDKLNIICERFKLKEKNFKIIKNIINIEWEFFDKVKGLEGRAFCQDSPIAFAINRMAQYLVYDEEVCLCIQRDYKRHLQSDFNPVFGKYAKMMQFTDPERYEKIKDSLPISSPVKLYALKEISQLLDEGLESAEKYLPETSKNTRPKESINHRISSIAYFLSEISFFNLQTIWLLRDLIIKVHADTFIMNIYKNTVELNDILS